MSTIVESTKQTLNYSMNMKYQIMGAFTFVPFSNRILTNNIIALTIYNGHDLNPVWFLLLYDFLSIITEVQCPRLLVGPIQSPAQPLGLVTLETEGSESTGNFPDNIVFRKANLFSFVMIIRTFLVLLMFLVQSCKHLRTLQNI